MGLVQTLTFNATEWSWLQTQPIKEAQFFKYSARMGYKIGLEEKSQTNRLIDKQRQMGLKEDKAKEAIKR